MNWNLTKPNLRTSANCEIAFEQSKFKDNRSMTTKKIRKLIGSWAVELGRGAAFLSSSPKILLASNFLYCTVLQKDKMN